MKQTNQLKVAVPKYKGKIKVVAKPRAKWPQKNTFALLLKMLLKFKLQQPTNQPVS